MSFKYWHFAIQFGTSCVFCWKESCISTIGFNSNSYPSWPAIVMFWYCCDNFWKYLPRIASTDTCSFIVIFSFLGTSLALRLKDIDVPPHRVVGEKARLVCKFDMEGDILYSVKWYKDDLEFYRFVPNDRPKLQVFPQKGIHVDVSKMFIQNYFKEYNSCSRYLKDRIYF